MATRKKRTRDPPAAPTVAATPKNVKKPKTEELFCQYAGVEDIEAEEIGPNGVMKFISDLQIKAEDIISLVLAWHFDAKRAGYFSKAEFISGMEKLKCTDMKQLRGKLLQLEQEVLNDPKKFEELYKYAFFFSRETDTTKVLDRNTAAEVLQVLMGGRPHGAAFVRWLRDEAKGYAVLNIDQWTCFLDFSRSVALDFSNFDDSSAWPLMLDDFARYCKEQAQMKT
jgi:hypothetical protein